MALPSRSRAVAIAALLLLALATVGLIVAGTREPGTRVARERPVAFNVRYLEPLREVAPHAGETLRLERGRIESFAVSPLRLPSYRGADGGILPIVAARELERLRAQYPKLELVEETRTRIDAVLGYSLIFRASRRPSLYGRLVLLPRPHAGARDGLKLMLLAKPNGDVERPRDLGARGLLKTTYRSVKFGS